MPNAGIPQLANRIAATFSMHNLLTTWFAPFSDSLREHIKVTEVLQLQDVDRMDIDRRIPCPATSQHNHFPGHMTVFNTAHYCRRQSWQSLTSACSSLSHTGTWDCSCSALLALPKHEHTEERLQQFMHRLLQKAPRHLRHDRTPSTYSNHCSETHVSGLGQGMHHFNKPT